MKKFYLLSLLALSAISMSAATPFKATLKNATPFESNLKVRTGVAQSSEQPKHAPAKVTNYGNETWNLLGDGKYASQALASCYGGNTDLVDVTVYEAEGKAGLYKVLGVWPDLIPDGSGTLYIDATDPECVVVEEQFTGFIDDVDGDTYIASISYVALEEFGYTKEEFLAGYSDYNAYVENGVIHFPESCLYLRWPDAPANGQYQTDSEQWYDTTESEGVLVLPGADYVDPWSEEVDATFVENIISPLFGAPTTTTTVKVKKNSETNVYRIIDPWRGLYDNIGAIGYTSPNLKIYASDPNNAIIKYTSTGISGGAAGIYYVLSYSYDMEDPSECPEENRITVTEDGGNTVITFPIESMILYASGTGAGYWASPDVSTITFKTIAGVDNITIDNNNDAKVEYFNLQGVRVENPSAGQLVIKRQGSVVTKEIVR